MEGEKRFGQAVSRRRRASLARVLFRRCAECAHLFVHDKPTTANAGTGKVREIPIAAITGTLEPGRAREFVMTGRLYDAATLESWNVVNRVLADAEIQEKGMAFAHELAAGPTVAHAKTKQIVRAYLDGGIDHADEVTPDVFADLFETEDLKRAVESFLAEGPGKFRDFKGV